MRLKKIIKILLAAAVLSTTIFLALYLFNCSLFNSDNERLKGNGNIFSNEGSSVLIVGSDTTYPPFEFIENGGIVGFDIDIISEIASRLEKDLEIVSISWDPEYKELVEGNLDMVISAVPVTEEKKEIIDFSIPYYKLNYLLISLIGSEKMIKEDLEGVRIGILETGKDNLDEDYLSKYEIITYGEIMGMIDDLRNKKIEGVLVTVPIAVNILKDNKEMCLVLDEVKSSKEFAIVFDKGSELKEEVDKVLEEIYEDGTYDTIYNKWFSYQF
ncbi:MAG: amino acid ABC transporter substrate-binding protein [Actinobacteria bacterium]|nr:amino acid ABC transporter substrate-binding protein [Actinomycetota bacterium]